VQDGNRDRPRRRLTHVSQPGAALGPPAEQTDQTDGGAVPFDEFAEAQLRPLSRLAYLLTGDHAAADDLAAEALLAAWNQWDRLAGRPNRGAYVRGILVHLAASRTRSAVRERRRIRLFHAGWTEAAPGRDSDDVLDVRSALAQLAPRRRACVVLRLAFDLSEEDVAQLLGVSVGTVKSQTSRGVAQLVRLLERR